MFPARAGWTRQGFSTAQLPAASLARGGALQGPFAAIDGRYFGKWCGPLA